MSPLFANIDAALPALLQLMTYGSHLLGLLFVGSGVIEATKKSADPRGVPGSAPVASMLSGGALMGLGYMGAVMVDTVTTSSGWSSSPVSALSYWPQNTNSAQQELITILKVVQLFGYLGVLRGIMLFNDAGKGGKNQSSLEHPGIAGTFMVFFGGIAINIKGFLAACASFFNFTLPPFLS